MWPTLIWNWRFDVGLKISIGSRELPWPIVRGLLSVVSLGSERSKHKWSTNLWYYRTSEHVNVGNYCENFVPSTGVVDKDDHLEKLAPIPRKR